MARERKQPEPEQQDGAPEWMVTFSDCMTLLLTFFVLLLSFSSFSDQDDFRRMSSAFANQISFGAQDLTQQDAMTMITPPRDDRELRWGSEKPTLEDGKDDRYKQVTEPPDFLKLNTFLVSSRDIFLGQGTVLSKDGQKTLSDLAQFLKALPPQVIIVSESGPGAGGNRRGIGFERAWAVCHYLITNHGLNREQFTLSAAGTAAKEYHADNGRQRGVRRSDRVLEFVLLKRSI